MAKDVNERPVSPALVIMVGPPGTGKSHLVREIMRHVEVATIQSDAIRRRMVKRPEYTPEENRKVFFVAHSRAEQLLKKGRNVIFDATNVHEWARRGLYDIAERTGARLLIVRVVAPEHVIAERLRHRIAGENPSDRSEAGWEVYLRMKAEFEDIARPHMVVDTSEDIESPTLEIVQFIQDRT